MLSLWKKLFMVVAFLLVISLVICGGLWHQLNATKTQLESAKTQLNTTKMELQSTKTQLVATKTDLDISETELDTTRRQLEMVESERNQMLDDYSDLMKQINMRLGIGHDCQSFITPNDPAISAKVREITGGYSQDVNERWRDYERLYRWVTRNIEYAQDSYTPLLPRAIGGTLRWGNDFWRTPAETLRDKVGDCEDMATLLTSMLLNYNEERFAVWCVIIHAISGEYEGHLAVAFPVEGDEITVLDPAGWYYTGYSASLDSDDVAVAVNTWLSRWAKDMPGAQVYVVFSNEFYRQFSSTQEFINWVRER